MRHHGRSVQDAVDPEARKQHWAMPHAASIQQCGRLFIVGETGPMFAEVVG